MAKEKDKGYRLNILLPSEYREMLDDLSAKTGMTKVALVGFAIRQYMDVYETQQAVMESIIRNPAQYIAMLGGDFVGKAKQEVADNDKQS